MNEPGDRVVQGSANVSAASAAAAREASGWRWLYLSAIVVLLDQLTKEAIVSSLVPFESIRVLPVLDITLMYNTGAAFSFLADGGGWQRWLFTALALGVGAGIVIWLRRLKARSQWMVACALALVLAGAMGNVIDRIKLGHVVDFIHAHWGAHYFPAFNVADSSITIGAALLLLDAFLEGRRTKQSDADTAR
jgi:signal peptidase II